MNKLQLQLLVCGAFVGSLSLEAATFCVNPAGTNGCVKTIAAAVTSAVAGDTINVAPGTYKESVTVGKGITLLGTDPATTTIDATGLSTGIYVDGIDNANLSGVAISGFTIENAKYEGILVTNASGVTINGNVVTGNNKSLVSASGANTCPGIPDFETNEANDCGEGIHFMGVSRSSIVNNTVNNNSGGILLSDDTGATHDNMIAGNVVTNNALACGITLASHVPAKLTGSATALGVYNNSVVNNQSNQNGLKGFGSGIGIFASAPGCKSYGNLVANNTSTGNGIPGVAMHGHAPNQVLDNNVIIGNTLSGNGPDLNDTATPGSAGIAITSVSPVKGTIVSQNTISNEVIGVAWNAPGNAQVQSNSFKTTVGVYNLGGGTVNADANWWGCNGDPTGGFAFIAGCSSARGAVTVTTWMHTAPSSK